MFQLYEWGPDENGEFGFKFQNLTTHICTEEELGLNDNAKNPNHGQFFKIHPQSLVNVKLYRKKFLCIDREEMSLYGDYNSLSARTMRVQLMRCLGKDYCKSEEEINQFMLDKYLLMLNNQIRFDSTLFGSESIIMESRISWFRVSAFVQYDYPFKVQRTEVLLQDKIADLDEITQLNDSSLFKLVRQPTRPEDRVKDIIMVISFEMDLNL